MANFENEIIGVYSVNDSSSDIFPAHIHDHNLCLFQGTELNSFIQLERYSGIKYDSRLPLYIDEIATLLSKKNSKKRILLNVDHELGRAFISASGKFRCEAPIVNKLSIKPEKSLGTWQGSAVESYTINHELAHIFSSIPFYGNFKENSLLVHFDGGASLSNFSVWLYRNKKIQLIDFHYKLKPLTTLYNANALSFAIVGAGLKNQNSAPGKLMGLASYGNYDEKLEKWLSEHGFFEHIWKSKKPFFEAVKKFTGFTMTHIDTRNSFIQDITATIQHILIRESIRTITSYYNQYQTEYLYFSGGVALNIKLNSKLIETNLFNEIFIPPCCNDTGLSLGAAAGFNWFNRQIMQSVSPFVNNVGIEGMDVFTYTLDDMQKAARAIYKNKILGICNGYAEIGPRALGNRSIVARADSIQLAKKISMECKKREWYRPIAPVMLIESFTYFTGLKKAPVISKFMLADFKILKNKKKELEGCVHVDETARIQVLSNRDENPYLYDLLRELLVKYNIKAIINTSFNSPGKPIVHTQNDAIKSARQIKLNGLVLQGKYQELL